MTDHVKHLPTGTAPEEGVSPWSLPDAERWLKARGPAVFAPGGGSQGLAALVAVSFALTPRPDGSPWSAYPSLVLAAALPLWYRYLPVPALPCAVGSRRPRAEGEEVVLQYAVYDGETRIVDQVASCGGCGCG